VWIFLNDAFVSIVADRHNDNRFLVRARFAGDIERLWPDAEVLVGAGSDYLFRAFLPRQLVAEVLAQRLLYVDYGNFKGSVRDWDRHSAYLGVWNEMSRAQQRSIPDAYTVPLNPDSSS
jgi:hypothetical protein